AWDHIKPNTQNIGVLAVMLLFAGIGNQTIGFIPTQRADCIYCTSLSITIALRTHGVSNSGLQRCSITKRFDELERDYRRSAIGFLRRHAKGKVLSPVNKRPPRKASDQPIGSLLADKPIEHSSCAGYLRFYEFYVAAIPPEVVHHSNPQ